GVRAIVEKDEPLDRRPRRPGQSLALAGGGVPPDGPLDVESDVGTRLDAEGCRAVGPAGHELDVEPFMGAVRFVDETELTALDACDDPRRKTLIYPHAHRAQSVHQLHHSAYTR